MDDGNDMAADVAQRERSNIKCYASAFSNIQINTTKRILLSCGWKDSYTTSVVAELLGMENGSFLDSNHKIMKSAWLLLLVI